MSVRSLVNRCLRPSPLGVLTLRLLLGLACSPLSFKKTKAFVVGLNLPNPFGEDSALLFRKLLGPVKKHRCVGFLIELSDVGINNFGGSRVISMRRDQLEPLTILILVVFCGKPFSGPLDSLMDFLLGGLLARTRFKGPLLNCLPTLLQVPLPPVCLRISNISIDVLSIGNFRSVKTAFGLR